jgi:hypothetical protein
MPAFAGMTWGGRRVAGIEDLWFLRPQEIKSFLLLFFKKEALAFIIFLTLR